MHRCCHWACSLIRLRTGATTDRGEIFVDGAVCYSVLDYCMRLILSHTKNGFVSLYKVLCIVSQQDASFLYSTLITIIWRLPLMWIWIIQHYTSVACCDNAYFSVISRTAQFEPYRISRFQIFACLQSIKTWLCSRFGSKPSSISLPYSYSATNGA
jgi:hypothetical protein